MGRLQNNPSIGWVHPKSTHAHAQEGMKVFSSRIDLTLFSARVCISSQTQTTNNGNRPHTTKTLSQIVNFFG
jgi:hypothetical protein